MPTTVSVKSVRELGAAVAVVRIAQGVRASELSVSHVVVGGLEHGKETTQVGKVLQILEDLGIRLVLEAPPGVSFPADLATVTRRRVRS